ncbi:uncharacterized protein LOC111639206 [Centruroides sculpturatus]|uniref:uncharacterized protein LOC111639206 n=1 Tax=Centruroides sculpturatus TaxID=218467 RepID=UPI000C6E4F1F|nr:uncharacterized protein LOC111639206 [Centruroides sculpturatus]
MDRLIENSKTARHTPTYAEQVAKPTQNKSPNLCRTKALTRQGAVILVKSKDGSADAESIKNKIRGELDPKALKIGITRVRKIRNKTVLIEIERKRDAEQTIINELNKIENITARTPKKSLPKVAIYGIPSNLSKEVIINTIFDQNDNISAHYDNNKENYVKEITAKFKWGKNPNTHHWVFEVTPGLKRILIMQKKLNIDWVRCSVEEHFSIIQCYRCCRYGHFARECKSERAFCNHCGGDHRYSECKNKGTSPSCINCICSKAANFAHKANHNSCTERMKVIKNITAKTYHG